MRIYTVSIKCVLDLYCLTVLNVNVQQNVTSRNRLITKAKKGISSIVRLFFQLQTTKTGCVCLLFALRFPIDIFVHVSNMKAPICMRCSCPYRTESFSIIFQKLSLPEFEYTNTHCFAVIIALIVCLCHCILVSFQRNKLHSSKDTQIQEKKPVK